MLLGFHGHSVPEFMQLAVRFCATDVLFHGPIEYGLKSGALIRDLLQLRSLRLVELSRQIGGA